MGHTARQPNPLSLFYTVQKESRILFEQRKKKPNEAKIQR